MPPPILPPKPPHLPNLRGEARPGGNRPARLRAGTRLTSRELDIVRLVAVGKRDKDIAAELGISPGTVKVYMSHLMDKLQLDGRLQVALWWRDQLLWTENPE